MAFINVVGVIRVETKMFFGKKNTLNTKKFAKKGQRRMIETIEPHKDNGKRGPN